MLICTILVTFHLGALSFIDKAQVEGKLLKEDAYNYLVDFSEATKKENYDGDYSKKLVSKDKCIKE